MGRKDIRHRETKKVKKGTKQAIPLLTVTFSGEPEVVRKKKPARSQDHP